MKLRIVLSVLVLVALAACSTPTSNPGIGTSPSGPTADDQPAQLDQVESPLVVPDAGVDAGPTVRRALPAPAQAGFPILAILEILSPLITTIIGKVFTAKVKDVSRRSEIASYADTAFHVVEALGKQYGWTGAEKYNRFIQQVIDSVKASGGPELTGPEMAQLQGLATTKALMAKVHAALPPPRPLPLPPPPRG